MPWRGIIAFPCFARLSWSSKTDPWITPLTQSLLILFRVTQPCRGKTSFLSSGFFLGKTSCFRLLCHGITFLSCHRASFLVSSCLSPSAGHYIPCPVTLLLSWSHFLCCLLLGIISCLTLLLSCRVAFFFGVTLPSWCHTAFFLGVTLLSVNLLLDVTLLSFFVSLCFLSWCHFSFLLSLFFLSWCHFRFFSWCHVLSWCHFAFFLCVTLLSFLLLSFLVSLCFFLGVT